MSSKVYWRKVCIFVWLFGHDNVVAGLRFTPLPSSNQPPTRFSLLQRGPSRQDASCPVDGHTACGNGAPDYFCCASDKTCLVVASGSTALCCPKGASCNMISTIICDITAQDVLQNPHSPIHTTKLRTSLPSCGERCCPFGYRCEGGAACVLVDEEAPKTSSADSTVTTKVTHITTDIPTMSTKTATTTAETTSAAERPPSSASPSIATSFQHSTPTTTAASQNQSPSVNASSDASTSGAIIAGATMAAVASVAGLTCLLWLKRQSIYAKAGSNKFPKSWLQLDQRSTEQDMPLPRYNSPPPAYSNAEANPPVQQQYVFKHYSPESVGSDAPVELPATPVSFSVWNPRSPREREPRPVRTHYKPYRRPE